MVSKLKWYKLCFGDTLISSRAFSSWESPPKFVIRYVYFILMSKYSHIPLYEYVDQKSTYKSNGDIWILRGLYDSLYQLCVITYKWFRITFVSLYRITYTYLSIYFLIQNWFLAIPNTYLSIYFLIQNWFLAISNTYLSIYFLIQNSIFKESQA